MEGKYHDSSNLETGNLN